MTDFKKGYKMSNGICVNSNETVTYIYLCGIKPLKSVLLSDNIMLMPVNTSPKPDDIIDCVMKNGNGSEFELGILISTLRQTTAMVKIECNDTRELAILTWNVQTTCVQISALINCEISWYFQANKPADEFDAMTHISMIYPNMYKFPSSLTIINEEQCAFLMSNMQIALSLSEDNRFANASNALWSHRWNPRPAVQLSIIWGGIESLFLIDRGIKSKLSTAASRFLSGTDDMVAHIKLLYEARCKAIHEMKNEKNELIDASVELLYSLILKCVELQSVPNVNELLQ